MQVRKAPVQLLVPLGLAAALGAHAMLQLITCLGFGAEAFALHPHSAIEPVTFVETALALWFFGCAVRNSLAARQQARYAIAPVASR